MGNDAYFEEYAGLFGIAVLIIWLAIIGLRIAAYVLRGLGLYDLARKHQARGAWTAWVPGLWLWALGAVADCHAAKSGLRRRWRWLLVIFLGIIALCYIFMVSVMVRTVFSMENADDVGAAVGMMGGIFVAYIPLMLALLAALACYPVCCYKVFEEIVPEKAMKYLLLSYLIPLAFGICLMRCARQPVASAPEAEADATGFVAQDPFF